MKVPVWRNPPLSRGYSLIEILLVVTIIAILAAVSLPMLTGYLRIYKIRGAAQEVAKEIQAVRGKAISRNVNFGTVFLTVDNTHYRWLAEDDQNPSDTTFNAYTRVPLASALASDQQRGPELALPSGVEFSQACPDLPTTGVTWEGGMRFNRLGAWCLPSTGEPCPPIGPGADFVLSSPTGAVVCLRETRTGLTRTVSVNPGGRVLTQQ